MLNIILTSYNRPDFVALTLRSIIAQTSPDWKCYILDDNSNAETLDAIRETIAGDNRFILQMHATTDPERKEATRYARLINSVLPTLRGGIVGYLCDNVEYHPALVAEVLDWFKTNPNAFIGYVTQARDSWTADGRRLGAADVFGHWPILPPEPGKIFHGPGVRGMLDHSQVYHRLPVRVRWNEDIEVLRYGDSDFFTRLSQAHGPVFSITTAVRSTEHLFS